MDPVQGSTDFQGWEILQANSDAESEESSPEIQSEGFIQTNYFSPEPRNSYGEDDKSAVSDNPSWIDPVLEEDPVRSRESGEFWSDSGSERSENREFTRYEEGNEVAFLVKEMGAGNIESIAEGSSQKESLYMNLLGNEQDNLQRDSEILNEEGNGCKGVGRPENEIKDLVNNKTNDLNKGRIVWWKMPMEFLKYCVFRMSPIYTVSFAAAVMGFVILGRRLYRMRNKAKALQVKVAVDNKKASQAMSQAARMNEAFSVVKRVPAIRPSYPVVGSSVSWTIASLR